MSKPRIAPVTVDAAPAASIDILQAVKAKVGKVPNLYATLAHAPAALKGLIALNEALGAGSLSAAEREIIALATAQANGCHYCLSAHSLLGKNAGLDATRVAQARAGHGSTARQAAIAALARSVALSRGQDSIAALATAREAGLSEGEIIEVVVGVAANALTNFTNNVADTEIDFPVVPLEQAA